MGEVLRAAVRKFAPFSATCFPGRIQLSGSVDQGWGSPVTFKLEGTHLKELNTVAKAVGATYNIMEVDMAQCVPGKRCMALGLHRAWLNVKFLAMIVNHMEEQREGMDSLNLCAWDSDQSLISENHFFSLMKVTRKWKIGYINSGTNFVKFFADLPTEAAALGHIDHLTINEKDKSTSLDVMKRIWEISVDVCLCTRSATSNAISYTSIGGGRGENPEVGWQQFLDYLHGN